MSTASYTSWSGNTVTSSVSVQPASLAKHPQRWSKDEVRVWLHWCTEEFSIDMIPPEKFDMNGKALCLLARSDFMERLPNNGDVLYNCLQNLISKNIGGGMLSQYSGATTPGIIGSPLSPASKTSSLPPESFTTGLLLVPSTSSSQLSHASPTGNQISQHTAPGAHVSLRPFIPIKPRLDQSTMASLSPSQGQSRSTQNLSLKVVERMSLDDDMVKSETGSPGLGLSCVQSPGKPVIKTEPRSSPDPNTNKATVFSLGANRSAECRLLWEFIHQLLLDTKFSKFVCWENREDYVFRIANPTGLAELWGQQKNRTNMTYEKLSRALRYYYRMNIIRKVPGKRLTYKFLQPPSMIQKGQRGAKPHSKIHLPSTVQSPANETVIKYEDESDFDSTPSDMDSPQNSESKQSRHSSLDKEDDCKHYNEKSILDSEMTHRTLTNLNMNYPYSIPTCGYSFGFERNYGALGRVPTFDSRHGDAHYLNLNVQNEYYGSNNRDRLEDKVHDWMKNKANADFHVEKVIRPRPSYPTLGDTWGSYDCLKRESSPHGAQITNSNDFPSIRADRVLRLPIDTLFRSQSCELPLNNNNELTVPHLRQRPGHARSVSPMVSGRSVSPRDSGVFQSEPEDLSMKKKGEIKSYDRNLDNAMQPSMASDYDRVEKIHLYEA